MMGFLLRKFEVEVREDLLGVVMEVSHEALTASLRKAIHGTVQTGLGIPEKGTGERSPCQPPRFAAVPRLA